MFSQIDTNWQDHRTLSNCIIIRICSIPGQRVRDKYSDSETEETEESLIFMLIN